MTKRKTIFERMDDVLHRGARCVEFCNYCNALCVKADMILWRGGWFCSKACIAESRQFGGPSTCTWGG